MSSVYEISAGFAAIPVEGSKIHAGIGWDPLKGTLTEKILSTADGLFNGVSAKTMDLNLAAIMKSEKGNELVFFGKKTDKAESLHYKKDNRTGGGDGEDERIDIDLAKVPADVSEIILFALIFDGSKDKKSFAMVQNFFVQVTDTHLHKVLYRNDTDAYEEEASKHSAYVFAKIQRNGDLWLVVPQHRFSDEDTEQDLMANL